MKDASFDCRTNIIICRIVRRFDQFVVADRAPIDRAVIDFRSRSRKRYRASCHPREMLFTPLTRLVSFGGDRGTVSRLLALRISPT